MFEQSLLANGPAARKTGAFFASFSAQIAVTGVLIISPLIFSVAKPVFRFSMPLALSPPQPEQAQAAPQTASSPVRPEVFHRAFQPPARILPLDPSTAGTAPIASGPAPTLESGSSAIPGLQPLLPAIAPALPAPHPAAPPRASVPPASTPMRVGGDVQAAKILRRVMPVYPALAAQVRVSGTVRLIGVIARDGTVQKLQVVSGNPLLVRAALDAVSQWLYKPTVLDGQAVEVIAPIDVIFTLSR